MLKKTRLTILSIVLFSLAVNVHAAPIILPAKKEAAADKSGIVVPASVKPVKEKSAKAQLKQELKQFKKENSSSSSSGMRKSKVAAALLAFFLGGFGVHRFYMGQKKQGFMQLGGTLVGTALMIIGLANAVSTIDPVTGAISKGSIGVAIVGYILLAGVGIWAFVDFIRILTGGLEPEEGFDS